MKSIYVIRHAIAADIASSWPTDAERPLTEEGIARWRLQVSGLRSLDASLDVVLTSPLVRCRQTADLLAEGLGGLPVESLDALKPGGRMAQVMTALGDHRRADAVAIVGHEPMMGMLVASLLGAQGTVQFKRGAVCRVDVEGLPPRAAGLLVWMLPPKVLRRLGSG